MAAICPGVPSDSRSRVRGRAASAVGAQPVSGGRCAVLPGGLGWEVLETGNQGCQLLTFDLGRL